MAGGGGVIGGVGRGVGLGWRGEERVTARGMAGGRLGESPAPVRRGPDCLQRSIVMLSPAHCGAGLEVSGERSWAERISTPTFESARLDG